MVKKYYLAYLWHYKENYISKKIFNRRISEKETCYDSLKVVSRMKIYIIY